MHAALTLNTGFIMKIPDCISSPIKNYFNSDEDIKNHKQTLEVIKLISIAATAILGIHAATSLLCAAPITASLYLGSAYLGYECTQIFSSMIANPSRNYDHLKNAPAIRLIANFLTQAEKSSS